MYQTLAVCWPISILWMKFVDMRNEGPCVLRIYNVAIYSVFREIMLFWELKKSCFYPAFNLFSGIGNDKIGNNQTLEQNERRMRIRRHLAKETCK